MVSKLLFFLQASEFARAKSSFNDVPLSTRISSSFGFLCTPWSVGVSGDMGIAASEERVIPRSWSATALRGLSAPDAGAGLPRGGVDAGRKAVFSSGVGGG